MFQTQTFTSSKCVAPFPSFRLSRGHEFAISLPCSSAGKYGAATGYRFGGFFWVLAFFFFFPSARMYVAVELSGEETNASLPQVEMCYFNFPLTLQQPNPGPRRCQGDLSVDSCKSSLALIAWPLKSHRVGNRGCPKEMWELMGGHMPFAKLLLRTKACFTCALSGAFAKWMSPDSGFPLPSPLIRSFPKGQLFFKSS